VYTLDFRLDRLNLRVGPVDGPDDRGATVIDASLG
jgi:hypothetical protein